LVVGAAEDGIAGILGRKKCRVGLLNIVKKELSWSTFNADHANLAVSPNGKQCAWIEGAVPANPAKGKGKVFGADHGAMNSVRVLDLESRATDTFRQKKEIVFVRLDRDGPCTLDVDGRITVWSSADGQEVNSYLMPYAVQQLTRLAASDGLTGHLRAMNLTASAVFNIGDKAMAWSRKGSISVFHTGAVALEDAGKAAELYGQTILAFSPDGKRAAFGDGKKVTVVATDNWREVYSFGAHKKSVLGVAFSNSGDMVASTDGEEIMLWEATSPLKILKVQGGP
jgi:WD40 repeat protein